jgi:cyclohexanone monooxygenase
MFVMGTQQSGQSANFQHMLDEQSRHMAHLMTAVRERGIGTVEASAQAEAEWTDTIVKLARARQPFLNECTPGYYNNEGKPNERTARNSQFWRGPMVFIRMLDAWRKEGSFQGLELVPLEQPAA